MITIVLHNIRSAHNAGSIFRTADALGASNIILCGYTPGPLDARGLERRDFTKVSLGAEKTVPYSLAKNIGTVIKKLKKEGYVVVAIELDKHATPIQKFKVPKKPIAVIFGNEVSGLPSAVLRQADH